MAWPIQVQWATNPPGGFVEVDASGWGALPDRGVPAQGQSVDRDPGWVLRAYVQGIGIGDDHVWVGELPDGRLEARTWSDNGFTGGLPWGKVWTLSHEVVERTHMATDGKSLVTHRGPWQRCVLYAPASHHHLLRPLQSSAGPVEVLDWSLFPNPPMAEQRHGILVPDQLWRRALGHEPPRWTP